MHRKLNQNPSEYYATESKLLDRKTILYFCNPLSGRIEGPYLDGEGREPSVAEILDAALDAFHEFGRQVGETVSVDFQLPSGRRLKFQGLERDGNIVFFEPMKRK